MTEGGLVRRSRLYGCEERMRKTSLRMFETVKAWIVSSGERQVMGVMGGGRGVRLM